MVVNGSYPPPGILIQSHDIHHNFSFCLIM